MEGYCPLGIACFVFAITFRRSPSGCTKGVFRDRIKIFATSRDGWILSLFFLSFLFYLFIYFFVGVFMDLDLSRSIETQKENLANIQPS